MCYLLPLGWTEPTSFWDDGGVELTPFRIERWYERYEFTTELMLSSSDCESVSVGELLALEPDARERLASMRLGYTEVPGSEELRSAIAALYTRAGRRTSSRSPRRRRDLRRRARPPRSGRPRGRRDALLRVGARGRALDGRRGRRPGAARTPTAGRTTSTRSSALLRPDTKLVYVNTPHNPTGSMPRRGARPGRGALRRARRRPPLRRGLPRARARPRRTRCPPACDLYERAISLGTVSKTYGLPGLRTGWVACRDARPARRDRGGQALHDDLLERPERASRRARAAPPERARRAEPLARPREPRARGRVRRAATPSAWTGCARRPRRSAFRACASTTRRRSASGSPPTRACCSSRARSTTSRATSASGSAGSALRRRSSVSSDSSAPVERRGRDRCPLILGVEVLLDEPEQHAVDPRVVAPVRLAADALADPSGALRVAQRALVEAVDLHLEPMEAGSRMRCRWSARAASTPTPRPRSAGRSRSLRPTRSASAG